MILMPVGLSFYNATDLPQHMQDRIVIDANDCWRWQAGLDKYGYGRCSLTIPGTTRRRWSAHRLAYQFLAGPIPAGLHLDHLCRVRNCVNPAHLEPVTPAENTRRSASSDFWRAKTHCPHGHEYDEANTSTSTRGARICRRCARDRMRVNRAKVADLPAARKPAA